MVHVHVAARTAVFIGIALVLSLLAMVVPPPAGSAPQTARSWGLADRARPGLAVGGVLHGYDLEWNQGDYLAVANQEFDAVTATAYLPWGGWPDPAEGPDTSGLDAVVQWAQANQKQVHGHALLYPAANQSSSWYSQLANGHEEAARTYVTEMAASNAGDVWVWDVVNEVMADPGDTRVDRWGLRNDYVEYTKIGSDYVDKAFGWAAAADPNALLIINDYGIAEINEKSTRLLAYVIELRRRGVPIDGVGFQMHLFSSGSQPDYMSIRANFQRFADAGFELFVTEMDVPIVNSAAPNPGPSIDQLQVQRSVYEEVARIATDQPAVQALLFWDFADDRSWLHPTRNDLGQSLPAGTFTFPAMYRGGATDTTMRAKPAYWGVAEGLLDAQRPSLDLRGRYVLASQWDSASGVLARANSDGRREWAPGGTTTVRPPDGSAGLPAVAEWVFISAGDGFYRIRSRWGAQTGYLTRGGLPVGDGSYLPGAALEFHPFQEWSSQLWRLESVGTGTVRIVNAWDPGTGVLTRDGVLASNQSYEPGATASLYVMNPAWSSQRWLLESAD